MLGHTQRRCFFDSRRALMASNPPAEPRDVHLMCDGVRACLGGAGQGRAVFTDDTGAALESLLNKRETKHRRMVMRDCAAFFLGHMSHPTTESNRS